jgi:hypothetical protein
MNDEERSGEYIPIYVSKPDTWRQAGWLPLLIAGLIVAVAFTAGLRYNSIRLKAKKAAEQAVIDDKNGIIRTDIEGVVALKLVEEKSATGSDGAIIMTIKSVNGTDSSLEVAVDTQNKFKGKMRNLDFSLVDISQNGKEIKSVEQAAELGEILTESTQPSVYLNLKKIHFNYAVGEARQFLLYCKFAIDGVAQQEGIAIPFKLK